MPTQDIAEYVKRAFGDESSVQITDEDIVRWINAAQREIVMHNESILETQVFIPMSAGVQEYDMPEDLMIHRTLRYLPQHNGTAYRHLEFKSLTAFDARVDGWDGTDTQVSSPEPKIYTTYDKKYYLYPRPMYSHEQGLKVVYSRKPDLVETLVDPISVPFEYENLIIKFCLSQASTLDEDYEAATLHTAAVQSDMRTLAQRQDDKAREVYPTITILPEDWG